MIKKFHEVLVFSNSAPSKRVYHHQNHHGGNSLEKVQYSALLIRAITYSLELSKKCVFQQALQYASRNKLRVKNYLFIARLSEVFGNSNLSTGKPSRREEVAIF